MEDRYLTRKTLIQRVKRGDDEAAWEEFSSTYQPFLYSVIWCMNVPQDDIEELIQQLFVKLWKKLPEFDYDPKRAKFRTWLSRTTKNHVINYIHAQRRRAEKMDVLARDNTLQHISKISIEDFDEINEREWKTHLASMALDNISELFSGKAIEVFRLSLKGVEVSDIAARLDLKEASIYMLRKRVKDRLVAEISRLREDLE